MFLAGENKQPKAAGVIQDTKENIVKHVSGVTVLEKFCPRRCQTKYMTIKCYEDAGNFQLRNPYITHFWRWMRTVVFKFAYSFYLFLSVLTGVCRLINPSRSDLVSFSATRGLYYNQPGHSCKEIQDSGFFQKDGEYWIDPEKNGKPLKVYCDMTTDGGKKYFGK